MSCGSPCRDKWRLHPDIVGSGGPVRVQGEHTLQVVVLSQPSGSSPVMGVDVLAHTPWPRALLYAFPPLQLILPLLERVRQERVTRTRNDSHGQTAGARAPPRTVAQIVHQELMGPGRGWPALVPAPQCGRAIWPSGSWSSRPYAGGPKRLSAGKAGGRHWRSRRLPAI